MTRADFLARRAASKRADILAAARAQFVRDGFEGAGTERIARDAGVSTATLFKYFPTKLELFRAVLSEAVAGFGGMLDATARPASREALGALAHRYADLLTDPHNVDLIRVVLSAATRVPAVSDAFYGRVKTVVAGAFHATVADLESQGLVRRATDPGLPGGQLMGMIEHVTLWRMLLTGDAPSAEIRPAVDAAIESFWTMWGAVSR